MRLQRFLFAYSNLHAKNAHLSLVEHIVAQATHSSVTHEGGGGKGCVVGADQQLMPPMRSGWQIMHTRGRGQPAW